ncbi:ATP-dependent helicase HrpB, partial [Vibrio harveyi]
GMRKKVD